VGDKTDDEALELWGYEGKSKNSGERDGSKKAKEKQVKEKQGSQNPKRGKKMSWRGCKKIGKAKSPGC